MPIHTFHRLITVLLLFVVVLGGAGASHAAPGKSGLPPKPAPRITTQNLETFFDDLLEEQLQREHIVGAAAAVVQGGETVFAKGYGYADLENRVPVRADGTLFFIGSDGKLFTWTAVMQLAEQGLLDLHADVNTYLDFEIPPAFGGPVTLHHLMTHTAGFEENLNALMAASPEDVPPLREFLVQQMPARVYPPGEVMAYSNYGTALAGYVVERVSGLPFEQYLAAHLLKPLGMARSAAGHDLPPELAAGLSWGYQYRDGDYQGVPFEWAAAVPAAPIRATAVDLGRFMAAHLDGGCTAEGCLLRPETLAEMHRRQFTHHPELDGMAYGFLETTVNGRRVLWHLGESARFITLLALVPEEDLGLLVAYNTPPANGRLPLFRFMDTFFPVERDPLPEAPLPGWEQRAARFNGVYVPARSAHTSAHVLIRLFQTVPVTIRAGALAFGGWDFVETGPGFFQQVGGDRQVAFEQSSDGRTWLYMGQLAYFQIPWHETPGFYTLFLGFGLLVFLLAWLGWPVWSWRSARRNLPKPGAGALWLAAGLGLFLLVLLGWLAAALLGYAGTLVFPQTAIDTIGLLAWLAVPWALGVLALTARAWLRKQWTAAWRLSYSLAALAAFAWLWLFWTNHLL